MCRYQGCRFSVCSVIFGPIRSLFSPISFHLSISFSLCVHFLWDGTHVDFQLFSQKSNGIPEIYSNTKQYIQRNEFKGLEKYSNKYWFLLLLCVVRHTFSVEIPFLFKIYILFLLEYPSHSKLSYTKEVLFHALKECEMKTVCSYHGILDWVLKWVKHVFTERKKEKM